MMIRIVSVMVKVNMMLVAVRETLRTTTVAVRTRMKTIPITMAISSRLEKEQFQEMKRTSLNLIISFLTMEY